MSFAIATAQHEQLFRAYTAHRDAVRAAMGYGVYPNLVKALAMYDALDQALANELADPDLVAYHDSLITPIAPYVAQMRSAAAGIVAIMRAIETAAPGTFDIAVT